MGKKRWLVRAVGSLIGGGVSVIVEAEVVVEADTPAEAKIATLEELDDDAMVGHEMDLEVETVTEVTPETAPDFVDVRPVNAAG